jgi:hypothetical protein
LRHISTTRHCSPHLQCDPSNHPPPHAPPPRRGSLPHIQSLSWTPSPRLSPSSSSLRRPWRCWDLRCRQEGHQSKPQPPELVFQFLARHDAQTTSSVPQNGYFTKSTRRLARFAPCPTSHRQRTLSARKSMKHLKINPRLTQMPGVRKGACSPPQMAHLRTRLLGQRWCRAGSIRFSCVMEGHVTGGKRLSPPRSQRLAGFVHDINSNHAPNTPPPNNTKAPEQLNQTPWVDMMQGREHQVVLRDGGT